MTEEQTALLAVLRHALTNTRMHKTIPAAPLLPEADRQRLLPLFFEEMSRKGISASAAERERIQSAARQNIRQYYRLLMLTKCCTDCLAAHGIQSAVLKGVSIAADFPIPEYRKSGDVDLLLADGTQIETASAALQEQGFTEDPVQKTVYHVALHSPDGVEVELHRYFTEPFESGRANAAMHRAEQSLPSHIVQREITGVTLPVLDEAYQAYSLLLHMLHHFLRAGFGLRLLCDWTVFWNQPRSEQMKQDYRRLVREAGVDGFSKHITSVCVRYLGLRAEPFGEVLISDAICRALLKECVSSGEFGKEHAKRTVILKSRSLTSYFRELHHQMGLNFPKQKDKVWLWGWLWLRTGLRFLINNHTVRHTSLRSVLREAKERTGLTEEMRLFQE